MVDTASLKEKNHTIFPDFSVEKHTIFLGHILKGLTIF